jgi:hypothetical protein
MLLAALDDASLEEFLRDPLLSVACILLIAVSVAWIIVVRLIVLNLRRAVMRRRAPRDAVHPPRDIWTFPP